MEIIRVISATLLLNLKSIPTDTFSLSNLEPLMPREKTASQPNNFWSKMKFMMNKEPKKSSPRKVFGTPLSVLASRWGIDSELGVGPSKIRIPIIVDELISNLRQMDMSVEGIFRKNGNIRRLRELTRLIDENPSEVPDLSKENAIQLSALLKKFIRELPEPILTVSLYNLWISSATIESSSEKQKAHPSYIHCCQSTIETYWRSCYHFCIGRLPFRILKTRWAPRWIFTISLRLLHRIFCISVLRRTVLLHPAIWKTVLTHNFNCP